MIRKRKHTTKSSSDSLAPWSRHSRNPAVRLRKPAGLSTVAKRAPTALCGGCSQDFALTTANASSSRHFYLGAHSTQVVSLHLLCCCKSLAPFPLLWDCTITAIACASCCGYSFASHRGQPAQKQLQAFKCRRKQQFLVARPTPSAPRCANQLRSRALTTVAPRALSKMAA